VSTVRVLHITTFLQGGAGRAITTLAIAQRRAGHQVWVVADAGGAPGYGTYPEYLEALAQARVPCVMVSSTFTRDLRLNLQAARQVRSVLHSLPGRHVAVPDVTSAPTRAGARSRQTPVDGQDRPDDDRSRCGAVVCAETPPPPWSLRSSRDTILACDTPTGADARDGRRAGSYGWTEWHGADTGAPFDIVHAHAAIPGLVAHLALRAAPWPVPIVHTMHGWGIAKTPEQERVDVTLLGRADAVVVPSAASAHGLSRRGLCGTALHVIPYGIEDVSPAPIDEADAPLLGALRARGRRVALCVGTIGARKRQGLLVEALAHPGLDNLHAVIIGDGEAAGLVDRARALNVADRLHVLGYRRDASRYLTWADLLVLPSRDEGLPLAVLEAFRAATPVVASFIPEIAEAVTDGVTGFLFDASTPHALAAALVRALCTPRHELERMRRSSRAQFETRYRLEPMIRAYERVYHDAIAARVARRQHHPDDPDAAVPLARGSRLPEQSPDVHLVDVDPAICSAQEWLSRAHAALADGGVEEADRFIRCAIECDPGNRAALDALEELRRTTADHGSWLRGRCVWEELDPASSLWATLYEPGGAGAKRYRVRFDDGATMCVEQTRERSYEDVRGPTELGRYRRAAALLGWGWRVLDLACGTGYGADFLARRGCRVWGADVAIDALDFARRRYPRVRFVAADARCLPFPPAFFDAVVSVETLEHLREGETMAAEVRRVLAPGGIWIVTTPVRGRSQSPYHLREYRREELEELLAGQFPQRQRWRWLRDDHWMEVAVMV
jgi:glycosyltransferase involved in cell wall biosynthesis/2-polyprenyl-3-methyl-5-hydroxy-6-metoxy-1,4-benzoquinol methylase